MSFYYSPNHHRVSKLGVKGCTTITKAALKPGGFRNLGSTKPAECLCIFMYNTLDDKRSFDSQSFFSEKLVSLEDATGLKSSSSSEDQHGYLPEMHPYKVFLPNVPYLLL